MSLFSIFRLAAIEIIKDLSLQNVITFVKTKIYRISDPIFCHLMHIGYLDLLFSNSYLKKNYSFISKTPEGEIKTRF